MSTNPTDPLGEVDIQEFDHLGSYMVDIMDINSSEKEFFNDIVFWGR